MSDCDITARSARGYCPGEEDEHQAEIDFAEDIAAETTAEVAQPEPITELPYTGPEDVILGFVGAVFLIVGAVLVRYAKHTEA